MGVQFKDARALEVNGKEKRNGRSEDLTFQVVLEILKNVR